MFQTQKVVFRSKYRVIVKFTCTWWLQYRNNVHRELLITLYLKKTQKLLYKITFYSLKYNIQISFLFRKFGISPFLGGQYRCVPTVTLRWSSMRNLFQKFMGLYIFKQWRQVFHMIHTVRISTSRFWRKLPPMAASLLLKITS